MSGSPVPEPTTTRGNDGSAIAVRGAVRLRSGARVLDGVDLHVAAGEIVTIVGPSGCGATTLLRAISGAERLDAGDARVGALGEAVPRVGSVFDGTRLPRFGRVHDGVVAVARRAGARDPEAEARACTAVVGLRSPEAPFHRLARGDRRRAILARTLAGRPGVLLLDDPLAGLHATERADVRDRLAARLRRDGTTALWVTRETSDAVAVADRVAVMVAGRIVASAHPESLYLCAADPAVAAVLGPVNAVPGIVADRVVDVWGRDIPLAVSAHDGHCEVVVRPDQVLLVGPDEPGIDAIVERTTFLGTVRRSLVRTDDGSEVQIEHSADDRLVPRMPVRIALAPLPVTTRPLA